MFISKLGCPELDECESAPGNLNLNSVSSQKGFVKNFDKNFKDAALMGFTVERSVLIGRTL